MSMGINCQVCRGTLGRASVTEIILPETNSPTLTPGKGVCGWLISGQDRGPQDLGVGKAGYRS